MTESFIYYRCINCGSERVPVPLEFHLAGNQDVTCNDCGFKTDYLNHMNVNSQRIQDMLQENKKAD